MGLSEIIQVGKGGNIEMKKTFISIILNLAIILTWSVSAFASWHVDIEFSTPNPNSDSGIASNKLSFGTDPAATIGYDNTLDTIALLNGPLHAYLSHPEYDQDYQRLWRDFRSESLPQEWEIEVSSSVTDQPVKITWQIKAPANLSFNLIDKESSQTIKMGDLTEYSYNSTSATTSKSFLLQVAENQNDTSSDDSSIFQSDNQGSSGSGGKKGGGCGYIKSTGGGNDPSDDFGQGALNMIILVTPLILTLKYRLRLNEHTA